MLAPEPSNGRSALGGDKPRVFYVSYDGMGEPLGRSQVLAYLFRLADDYSISLLSFEKTDADRAALAAELQAHGIEWHPLSYHKRPAVFSTLFDAALGCSALRTAARRARPDIVHVRSYVPALMALWARRWTGGKLLFDMRGFWVDERVEGGVWRADRFPYRVLFRIAKWCERRFFQQADAVVTLTRASVPRVRSLMSDSTREVVVIPTCVDLDSFSLSEPREDGPHIIWCGSVGTWYRFELVPALARALSLPLHVITRQVKLATAVLDGVPATVEAMPPQQVPTALRSGDVGVSLCVGSASKIASAPTRLAEYLASGMPVIVNPGVGDVVELVEHHRVGVVLRGDDAAAIADAADQVRALMTEGDLASRCRAVARRFFDVSVGSRQYAELYMRLAASERNDRSVPPSRGRMWSGYRTRPARPADQA